MSSPVTRPMQELIFRLPTLLTLLHSRKWCRRKVSVFSRSERTRTRNWYSNWIMDDTRYVKFALVLTYFISVDSSRYNQVLCDATELIEFSSVQLRQSLCINHRILLHTVRRCNLRDDVIQSSKMLQIVSGCFGPVYYTASDTNELNRTGKFSSVQLHHSLHAATGNATELYCRRKF